MPHIMPGIQSPSDHQPNNIFLSPLWKNDVKHDGGTITLASGVPPVLFVTGFFSVNKSVRPILDTPN